MFIKIRAGRFGFENASFLSTCCKSTGAAAVAVEAAERLKALHVSAVCGRPYRRFVSLSSSATSAISPRSSTLPGP
jgi:hypothetical protein